MIDAFWALFLSMLSGGKIEDKAAATTLLGFRQRKHVSTLPTWGFLFEGHGYEYKSVCYNRNAKSCLQKTSFIPYKFTEQENAI